MNLKVLLISPTALPVPPMRYGGIEKVVYDLCNELSHRGHDVTLAAPKGSIPPEGVSLIPTTLSGRIENEKKAYKLYAQDLDRFDIVCDHSISKAASAHISWNGPPYYIPVCHILDSPRFPTKEPRLVCVSRSHAEYIGNKYGLSPKFIYNGLQPSEYPFHARTREPSSRFLFIGRLTPEKGGLEAIRVCRSLGVPLDIIEGRGMESNLLRLARHAAARGLPADWVARHLYHGPYGIDSLLRAIREVRGWDCRYLSNVTHKKKLELLSSAKALLLPLQYEEPFGLVAIESMACGTPVVAYARGAMKELIQDGKTGFLVEPDDEGAFKRAMSEVSTIRAEDCRARFLDRFTAGIMSGNYETLFKEVIGGAKW